MQVILVDVWILVKLSNYTNIALMMQALWFCMYSYVVQMITRIGNLACKEFNITVPR